jgi:hypothetical protein
MAQEGIMTETDLNQRITDLHTEALALTNEVLDQGRPSAAQLEQAELISRKLKQLQSEVSSGEDSLKAKQNLKLQEIQRYLIALVALGELEEVGLDQEISRLSAESFKLAQEAARGKRSWIDLEKRASEINTRLEEIWPEIEDADSGQSVLLRQAWTDARLDVGYVLSGGELATSIRLHHYLQSH